MTESLKKKIKELSDIAKSCPDNLQEICFEILLKDQLAEYQKLTNTSPPNSNRNSANGIEPGPEVDGSATQKQEDFVLTNLHTRTRKFLSEQNLNIEHINQIFYKEGDKVQPLFDDLKTTKLAESQIRIALLQALRNAIFTGNFEFDGEDVRSETDLRKCYDSGNFAAIFKKNKNLFNGFEKYSKKASKIKLSNYGKTELASIMRDLQ